MMASQQFVETAHAKIYSAHRPDVPPEIAEKSVNFLKEKFDGNLDIAVDVGCGCGQSSVILAPFFSHVYGLDASEAQIQEAIKNRACSNIHYRVQEAENLPFETCSVQLVTACASLHWFNLELFFNEVRRILVPGGVLVVYTYHSLRPFFDCPLKMKEVNCLYNQIYEELYPYWPKEVHLSLEKYESVQFPFEESNKIPDIRQFFFGRFSDLTGFVESLSAFQIMKKTDISKAENFISRFGSRLHDLLAVPDQQDCKMIKLYRDFYCIMCRKK
ncbi:putative methyltransferase DDB_G0268948 isoform X2 [Argiope bruennichi]|uniref:putative methyltransferase DDB_G0268948 isoform X2 n=1 Tax=Argiope bruennichi TaxID=94029 RepID=UPI0024957DDF|nr:putative methyltransferase DDB_G0268948 isoform X2 [Argiope bruennichi]